MKRHLLLAGALLALLSRGLQSATDPKTDKLPRLSGAMLLVGEPPRKLFLTTAEETWTLQDDEDVLPRIGASISRDGKVVASAHRIPGYPIIRDAVPLVVSTYAVKEGAWTDHSGLEVMGGSLAISPNGALLAYVSRTKGSAPSSIHILNLKTGEIKSGPEVKGASISWAPDSQKIAFGSSRNLYVLEIATGSVSKIANGLAVSWSPSGKWISFVAEAGRNRHSYVYELRLVRPDGTDSHVVMKFESDVIPGSHPVWSPDSQTLLLNVSSDPDKNTWDVYQVDLETMKHWKQFKNLRVGVFGWVATN